MSVTKGEWADVLAPGFAAALCGTGPDAKKAMELQEKLDRHYEAKRDALIAKVKAMPGLSAEDVDLIVEGLETLEAPFIGMLACPEKQERFFKTGDGQ